jgi:hypothetical protein
VAPLISLGLLLIALVLFVIKNPEVLLIGTVIYLTVAISFWFLPGFILSIYSIGTYIEHFKGGK